MSTVASSPPDGHDGDDGKDGDYELSRPEVTVRNFSTFLQ